MSSINEDFSELIAKADQPFYVASDKAIGSQRTMAFMVVVVPLIGVIIAFLQAVYQGISLPAVAIFAVMYILGMLGITLGYHRHFAHRSFKTSKLMRFILGVLGSMSAQGPIYFWVATHRRHHIYSDEPGDPHSPQLHGQDFWGQLKGFWYGHIGWMFSKEQSNWAHFVPDLLKDRDMFVLHRTYFLWLLAGLVIPALVGWLWIGGLNGLWLGFLWGGLVRVFCVNHGLWAVGSISHMFGGHPYRHITRDYSANNWVVSFLTFGEGNQNNHHAFPASAKHGLEWWQPDFTFHVIRGLSALGVIWNVRIPKRQMVIMKKQEGK